MYKLETAVYVTENVFTYTKVNYSFFKPRNSDSAPWYNPANGILFFKNAEAVFACNAEKYTISGDALVFLPANSFCRVTFKKEYALCYISSFFPDLVCQKSDTHKQLLEQLTHAVKASPVVSLDAQSVSRVEGLFRETTIPENLTKDTINVRFLQLACFCFESCPLVPVHRNDNLAVAFEGFTDYIFSHLHSDLNLDMISDHFHYDKNYFCRRFKKDTNFTFAQFLTICRIVRSVEYLYNGYSLEAAGKFCGYKNVRSYVRAFTSLFRISPKNFVNNINSFAFSSCSF